MAVKISGLNLLNANYYDRMRIIQNNNGYKVHIETTGSKPPEGLFETVAPVFRNNQNQSDRDKIIAIVTPFLQYTAINKIVPRRGRDERSYDVVSGTRTLKLKIDNPLSDIVKQILLQKYLDDRLKFCIQNNCVKKITISPSFVTSYETYNDLYTGEPERIKFSLLYESGKIIACEKQFVERFITDKLNECVEPATFKYRHIPFIIEKNNYAPGFAYLMCGDLDIDIFAKKELIEMVQELVDKHNKAIEQSKRIQLKMEGF